ncbi:MAG: META domain-containing protein [Rhizobacter sp.]
MSEPFFLRVMAICLIAVLSPAPAAAPPAASASNVTLRDTRWVVQTLDGGPLPAAAKASDVHLVLHASTQHLSGFTGCNRLRGRYTQSGTRLALSAASSSRIACSPALMQQEQRLLDVLTAADAYRIEGPVLSLMQGETVRITFKASRAR